MLDKEIIKYIGKLCKLEFTEEEAKTMGEKLENIFLYMDTLKSVEVEEINISPNSISFINDLREDEIKESLNTQKIFQNAPNKEDDYFKVPKVMD